MPSNMPKGAMLFNFPVRQLYYEIKEAIHHIVSVVKITLHPLQYLT